MAASQSPRRRRRWMLPGLVLLVLVAVAVAGLVWTKFFKSAPQDFTPEAAQFRPDDMRFAYGSLGGEQLGGIPYPVFMVLPRIFPDLVAKYATAGYGPAKTSWGGYGAFGLPWEEGQRLPIGLSIKRGGYERVTANCAFCHTASYRLSDADNERFALGGPAHTTDVRALLRFLIACANDARFTPARLLPEISINFHLDPADAALYAALIIPKTRAELRLVEKQLGFMEQRTAWGPGRDDAFNLPKFVLTQQPWDASVSNTDFPAVWRLAERDGGLFHAAGEARDLYSVVATSALGTGSVPNTPGRDATNRWIEAYVRAKGPPPYPAAIDPALVAQGRPVFAANCAGCHALGGARTRTSIPIGEIGTDPAHLQAWTAEDARRANLAGGVLGFTKAKLVAGDGYVAKPLVGVWLLGPYLHNGSAPTIADLLAPPAQRPAVFWRGYDVIDQARLGFDATSPAAQAVGFRFDTHLKGNGNGGHLYGVTLGDTQKRALIEYLKTL